MKNYTMWLMLAAIVIFEIIVYFAAVAPQGAEIEKKTKALKNALRGKGRKAKNSLSHYVKMGPNVPTIEAVNRHKENRKILENEFKGCKDFYELLDNQHLKRWFSELGFTDWSRLPPLPEFQTRYSDQFKRLTGICDKNGVKICQKDALAMSQEEQTLVQEIRRFAQQFTPQDTVPVERGGGFWETNQLTLDNMRTAQKQFWIQEQFVNALVEAGGTRLVYVSFHREAQPPAQPVQKEENIVDKLMDRIPVRVIVRLPYGSISRM